MVEIVFVFGISILFGSLLIRGARRRSAPLSDTPTVDRPLPSRGLTIHSVTLGFRVLGLRVEAKRNTDAWRKQKLPFGYYRIPNLVAVLERDSNLGRRYVRLWLSDATFVLPHHETRFREDICEEPLEDATFSLGELALRLRGYHYLEPRRQTPGRVFVLEAALTDGASWYVLECVTEDDVAGPASEIFSNLRSILSELHAEQEANNGWTQEV
ncbi:MAG: hypothetical protein KDD69_03740 [Bdellovibrionales bacterium]|nr:hypothetical protein [Bdellovibrionales bacterium]